MPTKYNLRYILAHLETYFVWHNGIFKLFKLTVRDNDILNIPSASDEVLGGHAVVIVGYDDKTETFDILNSHGSKFADGGYFCLKYDYALNPDLAFEYYVVS